ncbi:MAG: SLBB domain-containing protein [Candidatus Krumholzibacteriota bacterium]|nr:SLBB domain-containing protein [Candidatus Krumholzibacteriota bacterium]
MKLQQTRMALILAATVFLLGLAGPVVAQVRLRVGDRLELVVPQRRELARSLVIAENGAVTIPIVGDVILQGLTVEQARSTILRRLQEIYPSVADVGLTLVGEEARRIVYVHGAVLSPGKYDFADAPNVWEAIREAGGTQTNAALDAVRIVRADEEGTPTEVVDIGRAIEMGTLESLPELRPGDTVIVPEIAVPYAGSGSVRVIGAVVTPAPYNLAGEKRLVDAILAAGGPTENADLSRVKVIRRAPGGTTMTIAVDFRKYLEEGDQRHNPEIREADVVSVPLQNNYLRVIFTDPRFLITLLASAATIIAVLAR